MLAGANPALSYVDFTAEMTEDTVQQALARAVKPTESVVFFCDLLGGTPFKQAVMLSQKLPNDTAVIAGGNIGSLLEVTPTLADDQETAAQLGDRLVALTQQHATRFKPGTVHNGPADDEDGI